jgi:hypothetical protein
MGVDSCGFSSDLLLETLQLAQTVDSLSPLVLPKSQSCRCALRRRAIGIPWDPTIDSLPFSMLKGIHVAGSYNSPPSDTRHFSFVMKSMLSLPFLWHAPLR